MKVSKNTRNRGGYKGQYMPNWPELLYKEKEQLSRTEYQDSLIKKIWG